MCFSFFCFLKIFLFVFHTQSGTTNNYVNESSELSDSCAFSGDSKDIQANSKKILSAKKNRFEIFDFLSNSERACLLFTFEENGLFMLGVIFYSVKLWQ